MGRTRTRRVDRPPTDEAARPIAAACSSVGGERLEHHRRRALPRPLGITIVGDAAFRAAPRACQYEQARVTCYEVDQLGDGGHWTSIPTRRGPLPLRLH